MDCNVTPEDWEDIKQENARLREALERVVSESKEVVATPANTHSVREGYELGGYTKHYIVTRAGMHLAVKALNGSGYTAGGGR
jgi:hypothetical protein